MSPCSGATDLINTSPHNQRRCNAAHISSHTTYLPLVHPSLPTLADGLAIHAVQELRSQDNVTVMIVYLRNSTGLAGKGAILMMLMMTMMMMVMMMMTLMMMTLMLMIW